LEVNIEMNKDMLLRVERLITFAQLGNHISRRGIFCSFEFQRV
jgi:hypothetical protein